MTTSRFLFGVPNRRKPKPGFKSLLVRCPATSKLTDTGQTVEEKRWPTTKVKKQRFICAHCGNVHVWAKDDVVLGRPLS